MLFREWRAQVREVPDLCEYPDTGLTPEAGQVCPGWLYPEGGYIWKLESGPCLEIFNESYTGSLEYLEAKLFEFQTEEGYFG